MSKPFAFNARDFAMGLVMAVGSAVLTWLAQQANLPGFTIETLDFQQIITISVITTITYLAKNFSSNEQGQVVTPVGKIG